MGLESIRSAIVRIVCGAEQGTAYVVGAKRLITCYHVVRKGDPPLLQLGKSKLAARVVFPADPAESLIAEEADTAVLEVDSAIDAVPLSLGSYPDGARWRTFGFPAIAEGIGLPVEGNVLDANGKDVNQQPAMILYSDQIAAGMATPVGGYSGSPIIVGDKVVGHLKRVLSERDKPGRPVLGLLFATPAHKIAELAKLGLATQFDAPASIREAATASGKRVFISYKSRMEAWARSLAENLQRYGIDVWLDQEQLNPGATLANTIQAGLTNARGAIALITQDWLTSPWCQAEANVLLQRAIENPNFLLVPVVLEDVKLPDLWNGRIWLDCRGRSAPPASLLDKLLKVLGLEESKEAQSEKLVQELLGDVRSSISADTVFQIWTQFFRTTVYDSRVAEAAAERLIQLGRPDYAIEVVGDGATSRRARQLKALALAKTERIEDSIRILERLEQEAAADAETGGMLAGRYREMWERSKDDSWRLKSRAKYLSYFRLTNSSYCGINAASLALKDGDIPEAMGLAWQVASALERKRQSAGQLDHWELATLAEAYLITDDVAGARRTYLEAIASAAGMHQDLAVIRKGARRIFDFKGKPKNTFDDIFAVRSAVAFFGHSVDAPNREKSRFPPSKISNVRQAIANKLEELRVGYGVSSAANGGDLLFLTGLLNMGGTATIVLPTRPDTFRDTFLHGTWIDRFDEICDKCKDIRVAQPKPREDVWDACRREIRAIVCERARVLQDEPNLLVLWDGESENYVKRAIDCWEEEGDPITYIRLGDAAAATQP